MYRDLWGDLMGRISRGSGHLRGLVISQDQDLRKMVSPEGYPGYQDIQGLEDIYIIPLSLVQQYMQVCSTAKPLYCMYYVSLSIRGVAADPTSGGMVSWHQLLRQDIPGFGHIPRSGPPEGYRGSRDPCRHLLREVSLRMAGHQHQGIR